MHIRLGRRRRGSLAMEGLMILPVVVLAILLGRFILEGMLSRQEVSVYTRGSTAAAAALALPGIGPGCSFDDSPFTARPGVAQAANVACSDRDAESGLRSRPGFWEALEDGARPFRRHGDLMRDIAPRGPVEDVLGRGSGTLGFTGPEFLAQQRPLATSAVHLRPREELYDHRMQGLEAGHDPVIWEALRRQGAWRLFPNVFPGAAP